jgi:hypothetical protein
MNRSKTFFDILEEVNCKRRQQKRTVRASKANESKGKEVVIPMN